MQRGWLAPFVGGLILLLLLASVTRTHAGPTGSGSGGLPDLRHATDCINGGVSGLIGQKCTDLDDGKTWICKTLNAGGLATVCDAPGDWLQTGTSLVDGAGLTSLNNASGPSQTLAATAPVTVNTNTGTNTTTVALGTVAGTAVSNTPAGTIAATTVQAAIDEASGDLTTHAALTTAHGASATPNANTIVRSTALGPIDAGWLPFPASTTKGGVLTGGECDPTSGKMVGISTGGLPVCGVDQNTGEGGGVGDALVANPLSQFAATTSAQLAGVISNETGSGMAVFGTAPTLVSPNLGTPGSATLTNATGLPIASGVSGLGAGVATALTTPTVANLNAMLSNGDFATIAGTETLTGKTLTAPTMADYTNAGHDHLDTDDGGLLSAAAISSGVFPIARLATGTPDGTKFIKDDGTLAVPPGGGGGTGDALVANPLSQFAATTSAQLAGVLSDETGSGLVVLGNAPTLTAPILGTPASVTLTNATGLPIASGVSGLGAGVATALATPTVANFNTMLSNGDFATLTGTEALTNKTLTAPTMADYTNAGHDHLDTDDGGLLSAAAISTGVFPIARLATGTPDGTKFIKDDGTLAVPPGGGGSSAVTSADCAAATIPALGLCIQVGPPDLLFACPAATGDCPTDGTAFALPPVDTDTGVLDLQGAWSGGKQIIGVNSLANGLVLCVDNTVPPDDDCSDAEDMSSTFYCDPATGCQWVNKPDGDMNLIAPTGFDLTMRIGTTGHVKLNHLTGKLEFLNTGQPLKSVEVPGHEFGTCTYTDAVIVASKPKINAFTCTDVDTAGFDFDFMMPLNWNAGTVTVRLNAVSVNATPTGNVVLSCSGQSISDGENIANKVTTNEQTVTLALATQYKEEQATSAAITFTGSTIAAGDHVYMHCDIDATGTTATMADVRINAMAKVFYTVNSTSE